MQLYFNTDPRVQIRFTLLDHDVSLVDADNYDDKKIIHGGGGKDDSKILSFIDNRIKFSFIIVREKTDLVPENITTNESRFLFMAKRLFVPLAIINRLPKRSLITNYFNIYNSSSSNQRKRKISSDESTEKILAMVTTKTSNRLTTTDSEIKINCPFHSDKNPSLSFNVKKHIFHCFGCNMSGNAIELLNRLQTITSGDGGHRAASTSQSTLH